MNTTGQSTSDGGIGLTTAQMTGDAARTNMTGFDFGTVWQTQPDDYPVLAALPGDTEPPFDGPPPVAGFDSPPTDPDGDGFYEDINGNGEANVVDVQAMFANRGDSVLTENPQLFDFSGNGEVDVVDVQALFAELAS